MGCCSSDSSEAHRPAAPQQCSSANAEFLPDVSDPRITVEICDPIDEVMKATQVSRCGDPNHLFTECTVCWPLDLRPNAAQPRTMQRSLFLRLYNNVPKNPPAADVRKHLAEVASPMTVEIFDDLVSQATSHHSSKDSAAQLAAAARATVQQWTDGRDAPGLDNQGQLRNRSVYNDANHALISESKDMEHWIWWIRALTSHVTKPSHCPKKDIKTYRGSKITDLQAQMLKPGQVVRAPMFLPSSENKRASHMFAAHGYIIEFNIPDGSRNACLIAHLSFLKDEEEVLIVPYSPLWVRSWHDEEVDNATYHVIRVDLLDSMVFENIEQGEVKKCDAGFLVKDGSELPAEVFGKAARCCVV